MSAEHAAVPERAAASLLVRGNELTFGPLSARCAVGRGGIVRDKREGDGGTPAGVFALRRAFYRADRFAAVESGLPLQALKPADGWCDDPSDRHYNQLVALPYAGRHEALWRDDTVYDLILVVGYNDAPSVPHRGSAIFVHLTRPGFLPTEGCVALELGPLLEIVRRCTADTLIDIRPD